jgi:hypothetical protein
VRQTLPSCCSFKVHRIQISSEENRWVAAWQDGVMCLAHTHDTLHKHTHTVLSPQCLAVIAIHWIWDFTGRWPRGMLRGGGIRSRGFGTIRRGRGSKKRCGFSTWVTHTQNNNGIFWASSDLTTVFCAVDWERT